MTSSVSGFYSDLCMTGSVAGFADNVALLASMKGVRYVHYFINGTVRHWALNPPIQFAASALTPAALLYGAHLVTAKVTDPIHQATAVSFLGKVLFGMVLTKMEDWTIQTVFEPIKRHIEQRGKEVDKYISNTRKSRDEQEWLIGTAGTMRDLHTTLNRERLLGTGKPLAHVTGVVSYAQNTALATGRLLWHTLIGTASLPAAVTAAGRSHLSDTWALARADLKGASLSFLGVLFPLSVDRLAKSVLDEEKKRWFSEEGKVHEAVEEENA